MQFDPSKGTPLSSSASTSLKRSLSQPATASARKAPRIEKNEALSSTFSSGRGAGLGSSSVFSPEFQMPTPSSSSSQLNSSSKSGSSGQRATRAAPPVFKGTKSKGRGKSNAKLAVLEGPLRDRDYIVTQYGRNYPGGTTLKAMHTQNPKSSLSNWVLAAYGTQPQYQFSEGLIDGRQILRYVLYSQLAVLKLTLAQMYCGSTDGT
jgi:hypothetical protein